MNRHGSVPDDPDDDGWEYVPTPLPRALQVAMGLDPGPRPPDAPRPATDVREQLRRLDESIERRRRAADRDPPPTSESTSESTPEPTPRPRRSAPAEPRTRREVPHDVDEPVRRRRTPEQLARGTVSAMLTTFLVIIAGLIAFGLLVGVDPPDVRVNDEDRCTELPRTVAAAELATDEYWHDC